MGGKFTKDQYKDDQSNAGRYSGRVAAQADDMASAYSSYSPEHHEAVANAIRASVSSVKLSSNAYGIHKGGDYSAVMGDAEKADKVADQFRMNPKLDNAGKDRIMNAVYGYDYAAKRGK